MAHWIVFPNADAHGNEDGAKFVSTFNDLQNIFKNVYPTESIIQQIEISEEDSENYGDIITKLIEGRFSFDILY
jgi:hypothetical protein